MLKECAQYGLWRVRTSITAFINSNNCSSAKDGNTEISLSSGIRYPFASSVQTFFIVVHVVVAVYDDDNNDGTAVNDILNAAADMCTNVCVSIGK